MDGKRLAGAFTSTRAHSGAARLYAHYMPVACRRALAKHALKCTGEKALENTVRQQAKNLTHIGTELVNG